MDRLDILVFGAGAIGTYVGGSLALRGHRLVFIEQPRAIAELQARGLRLELPQPKSRKQKPEYSSFTLPPSSFHCVSSLNDALPLGPFDAALLALKSFDTAAALEEMKRLRDQIPPILCLSNGVDNEPALEAALGADRVIAGTVTSAVGRRGVGDIVLERRRGVGLVSTHPLADRLSAALTEAGLNAQTFPRAADMKWSKMLTNLPANATAAILDMTAAEVFAHPGLFRLEMEMLREALAVMRALGVRVVDLPGVPVRALALGTKLPEFIARPLMQKAVGGGRGGKMPSFHIDLHSGRGKSEVEWLNGAVVRYGEKAGVPTPVNHVLTETLLALTRGEVPLTEFSRQPEKLLGMAGSKR
jgi:2-dehydropantoate 2-reductase